MYVHIDTNRKNSFDFFLDNNAYFNTFSHLENVLVFHDNNFGNQTLN